jgi:hypothetical protein
LSARTFDGGTVAKRAAPVSTATRHGTILLGTGIGSGILGFRGGPARRGAAPARPKVHS